MSRLTFIKYWWANSKRFTIFIAIVATLSSLVPTGIYFTYLSIIIWLISIVGNYVAWKKLK